MNVNEAIEYITKWRNKYTPNLPRITFKYELLNSLLGICHTDVIEGRYAYTISINEIFKDDWFTPKIILWHEFAHVMCRELYNKGGHDTDWIKCWFKKPLWTIPAYIVIAPNVIYKFIKKG